jgi:hypothetical protein
MFCAISLTQSFAAFEFLSTWACAAKGKAAETTIEIRYFSSSFSPSFQAFHKAPSLPV